MFDPIILKDNAMHTHSQPPPPPPLCPCRSSHTHPAQHTHTHTWHAQAVTPCLGPSSHTLPPYPSVIHTHCLGPSSQPESVLCQSPGHHGISVPAPSTPRPPLRGRPHPVPPSTRRLLVAPPSSATAVQHRHAAEPTQCSALGSKCWGVGWRV